MESVSLLDCAGRRRSPATLSSFRQGRSPRNKGLRYPPDPPTVEEIIAVMRAAGDTLEGVRLRAVIVVLWRAGLRISEALALSETDLDRDRGAVLVRHGKGGMRREVGMDRWGWEHLEPWLELRRGLPVGPLFCVLRGPLVVGRARLRGSAASYVLWPSPPGFAVGSRRTSCGMRTRSRCRVRGSRCWSSSGSSVMPTSRSPRRTCAGSITPRSSTRVHERSAPMVPATPRPVVRG
jgi:integrase